MYSPLLLDHFESPRNTADLPCPDQTVEVSNPACGDMLRLSVSWDGDRLAGVAFKVRGCTASVAAGSALTELMVGKRRGALRQITAEDLSAALGGLPAESRHAAGLCLDALRAILK